MFVCVCVSLLFSTTLAGSPHLLSFLSIFFLILCIYRCNKTAIYDQCSSVCMCLFVCVCTRVASSNWLFLLLLLVLLPFVDNLDCFDRWLLNRVLSIYTLMRFHPLFICGFYPRFIFSVCWFVVCCLSFRWLVGSTALFILFACLFLRLLISFHSIPLATPGPHRPIHKTFDCVRQRISAILISPVDQHTDAFGLLFHANIYRPYHFAGNRNL